MLNKISKTKNKFLCGVISFGIFLIISFFQTPEYDAKKIIFKDVRLLENPGFIKTCGTHCSYSMKIKTNDIDYELYGIDYKYLSHKNFKEEVRTGDVIKIGIIGDDTIVKISSNEIEYLQFDKAQNHKRKNRLFSRTLFLTGLIFCLIPLFFSDNPTIKYDKNVYWNINFGIMFITAMILAFLILSFTIGVYYISGSEFIG